MKAFFFYSERYKADFSDPLFRIRCSPDQQEIFDRPANLEMLPNNDQSGTGAVLEKFRKCRGIVLRSCETNILPERAA
jgi:hypothetical protein